VYGTAPAAPVRVRVVAFGLGASEGSGSPARQPPHPGPPSIWALSASPDNGAIPAGCPSVPASSRPRTWA
jgi:hypothetical protein